MAFVRRVEDFVCDNCATANRGDGYTNHCYRCLYSRHVDNEPGDRGAGCHGVMVPIGVEVRAGAVSLIHRCQRCRIERRCRTSPQDDPDAIAAVSALGPVAPRRTRRRRP
jgi:hypothetical protein